MENIMSFLIRRLKEGETPDHLIIDLQTTLDALRAREAWFMVEMAKEVVEGTITQKQALGLVEKFDAGDTTEPS